MKYLLFLSFSPKKYEFFQFFIFDHFDSKPYITPLISIRNILNHYTTNARQYSSNWLIADIGVKSFGQVMPSSFVAIVKKHTVEEKIVQSGEERDG